MALRASELRLRKRLKNDFVFFAKRCLKIRDKRGAIVPLALNPAQTILHNSADPP